MRESDPIFCPHRVTPFGERAFCQWDEVFWDGMKLYYLNVTVYNLAVNKPEISNVETSITQVK